MSIRFTLEASGTLVELEHSYLERHGEGWEQFRDLLAIPGSAWSFILIEFSKKAEKEVEL